MNRFGVSKVTVVRALADLEAEGVVRREHGRGTFVARTGASAEERFAPRDALLIVLPEIRNPLYAEIASHFDEHFGPRKQTLAVVTTSNDLARERDAITLLLKETRLTGMLFVPVPLPHDIPLTETIRVPLAVLGRCPPSLAKSALSITSEDFQGGRMAGRHLLELGHERIGYATYEYGHLQRLNGLKSAIEEVGLAFSDEDVFLAASGMDGPGPVAEFIRQRRVTALLALNDMLAIDIMAACREAGVQVPGDVSICGYDNVALSRCLDVPLTSVEVFADQIARRAAEEVRGQIEAGGGPLRPREVVVMPQLLPRASTAPPSRRG
jgi:DNA-binding LacI/PurR family transcriptional regulator